MKKLKIVLEGSESSLIKTKWTDVEINKDNYEEFVRDCHLYDTNGTYYKHRVDIFEDDTKIDSERFDSGEGFQLRKFLLKYLD